MNRPTSTGFKGVRKKGDRFSSAGYLDGKNHYLGTFDTAEEAHAAYLKAKEEHK